jgi:hypothetical protein
LVAAPNRFLREADETGDHGTLRVSVDDVPYPLIKMDYGVLQDRYQNDCGRPEMYAIVGGQFVLAPIPDQDYTIKIGPFYKGAETLEFETTNLWTLHAPRYLEAALGNEMAFKYIKDVNVQQFYTAYLQKEKSRLFNYSESRKHVGRSYLLGDED